MMHVIILKVLNLLIYVSPLLILFQRAIALVWKVTLTSFIVKGKHIWVNKGFA